MAKFSLTLPYQTDLTDNHRLGRGRGGRTFLKKSVKEWQSHLAIRARNALNFKNLVLTPPVTIRISYFLPIGCTADVANFHKTIGDGLKRGVDIDDRYFRFVDEKVEYVKRSEARFVLRVSDAQEIEDVPEQFVGQMEW